MTLEFRALRRLAKGSLLFILVCLLPGFGLAQEAKSVEELARILRESGDRVERREAAYHLDQLGKDALPALDTIVKGLADGEEQVWFHCIQAIAKIGPAAAEHADVLVEQLGNPQRRRYRDQVNYRTAFALGQMGTAALPAIQRGLSHEGSAVRAGSAKAITWIREDALALAPELIRSLSDAEEEVRINAAEALGSMGEPVISELVRQLDSESEAVRIGVLQALGLLGETAKGVSENLIERWALESSASVRRALIAVLPSLRIDPIRLTPLLIDGLMDPQDEIRQAAINAILLLPQPEQTTVPALRELLMADSVEVQERAAYVLGNIGPSARAAIPDLIQLRMNRKDSVASQALSGIGRDAILPLLTELYHANWVQLIPSDWRIQCLTQMGEQAMPDLAMALQSQSKEIRFSAVEALRGLGDSAKRVETQMAMLLADSELKVRAAALQTLVEIEADAELYLQPLSGFLQSPNGQLVHAALKAAQALGSNALPVLPQLIALIESGSDNLRSSSLQAIAAIGPSADQAEPAILALLSDENASIPLRSQCLETLGQIEADSKNALKQVRPLLSTENVAIRAKALTAVGFFKSPGILEVLPEVRSGLGDAESQIRQAAILALIQLIKDSEEILDPLVHALSDESEEVRRSAIEGIAELGRRGRDAAPKLFELLDNESDRASVVDCIRRIQPRDPELFRKALANADPEIRSFACESLERLGDQARSAIEDLRKLREQDDYDFVRTAARSALRRIAGRR